MMVGAIILTLITLVEAIPRIAFPINSQVPPVARVSQPFNFGFPASTFSSDAPSLNYTLSNAPPWLHLNGGSRLFLGTPTSGDVGPVTFQLTATDTSGSANMDVTFIVSSKPSPQLGTPISDQLRTLGLASDSSSIMFYPLAPFSFALSKDTFMSTEGILTYYAVSADNTPLPAWVNFDSGSLKFSGVTPPWTSLVGPPQRFDIRLIASDVLGFAGAAASLSLVVSDHMLVFSKGDDTLNVTKGVPVNVGYLRNRLLLDGHPVSDGDLKTAEADVPDWLSFDNQTLILHGTPPPGVTSQVINISVTDVYGDVATDTIWIRESSTLFAGSIGNLTAIAGKQFNYTVSRKIFKDPNVVVVADISPSTSWLTFNSEELQFEGTVPHDVGSSDIKVNLTATSKSSLLSDFEVFTIGVENPDLHTLSAIRSSGTTPTTSQIKASQHMATPKPGSDKASNRKGRLAALVVIPCLFLIAAIAGMIFWCTRHRGKNSRDKTRRSPLISRPLERIEDPWPTTEKAKSLDHGTLRRAPFLGTLSEMWRPSADFQHLNGRRAMDQPASGGSLDSHGREVIGSEGNAMEFVRLPQGDSATSESTLNFSFKTPARPSGPQRPRRPDEPPDAGFLARPNSRSFGSCANGNGNALLGRRLSGVGHGSGGYGPPGYGIPKRSWRRAGSSRNWGTVRESDMSAVTESTDVLLNESPSIRIVTSPDPVGSTIARPERRGYVRRRGQSPFFGGASRAGSSKRPSRAWGYTPGQSVLSISQANPVDSASLLDSVLRDLKAMGNCSLPSTDENDKGLESSARFSLVSQASRFSDNSSRFKSVNSSLHSRDFSRDESNFAEVMDEAGHRSWYRNEVFANQGSFYSTEGNRGSILEYETVRLQGVVGGDGITAAGTSPRLKLVDFKGKRPVDADMQTPRGTQSGGSVAGDLAFL